MPLKALLRKHYDRGTDSSSAGLFDIQKNAVKLGRGALLHAPRVLGLTKWMDQIKTTAVFDFLQKSRGTHLVR